MIEAPLHTTFYRSLFKPDKFFGKDKSYRPKLMSYRRRLEKAQRFALSDKAVGQIVERADLDLKHLMDRVQLALLPFDEVWIEYNQHVKITENHKVGRGPKPTFELCPEKVGFLIRRAGGPEQWIATRITGDDEMMNDGGGRFKETHGLSMFDYVFDATSMKPIAELGGQRTFIEDLPVKMEGDLDQTVVARGLWGGMLKDEHDPLREADKKGTIALNPLWRTWFHDHMTSRAKAQKLAESLVTEFLELKGEMRFLVTALAIINEVPILLTDVPPTERTFYGGGKMQPYLTHRTVEINIPIKGRKQRSIADYLKVAASKKRRHMVRGHVRRYRDSSGQIVREQWIEAHARGSAELGWVNHDYHVDA